MKPFNCFLHFILILFFCVDISHGQITKLPYTGVSFGWRGPTMEHYVAFSVHTLPLQGFVGNIGLNSVIFVGGDGAASSGTNDIGAQINAAYAALPAGGGRIEILPKSDGSCYSFTTPVPERSKQIPSHRILRDKRGNTGLPKLYSNHW